jgi:hypothetical protein
MLYARKHQRAANLRKINSTYTAAGELKMYLNKCDPNRLLHRVSILI